MAKNRYKNVTLAVHHLKKDYRIRFRKSAASSTENPTWYLDKAFDGKSEMDARALLDSLHMTWDSGCDRVPYLMNKALTSKWIDPSQLSTLIMGCKSGDVIDNGEVWHYVGIGWVPVRLAYPADFRDLPVVSGPRVYAR